MRSHISCATSSVCVLIRIATPRSLMRRKTSLIRRAPRGSRPTIGSSTTTACGRCRKAAHMTSRCFMPCEKLSTSSFSQRRSSKSSSISCTRPVDAVAVEAVEAPVKPQELAGGELLVDERPIGDESERRLRELRLRGDVVPVDHDAAGGRLQQPGDHAERRRLSRAVRAEEAVNLSRLDVEADAVDRGELAVLLDEIVDGNHRGDGLHQQQAPVRRCGTSSEIGERSDGRPIRIGVAFSASFMSRTVILSRPMSGRMAACLSRPPRASRRCVASAGNSFSVGSTGSQRPRPDPSSM